MLWGCITKKSDWLKNLAPLVHPIRSKPEPIAIRSQTFSRALGQLPVCDSSFDWFTGFPLSFVISKRDDFGSAFTELLTANFNNIFSLREFLGSNTSVNRMSRSFTTYRFWEFLLQCHFSTLQGKNQ